MATAIVFALAIIVIQSAPPTVQAQQLCDYYWYECEVLQEGTFVPYDWYCHETHYVILLFHCWDGAQILYGGECIMLQQC